MNGLRKVVATVELAALGLFFVLAVPAAQDVQAQSAGPTLPAAEYKPLLVDTRIYYSGWSFQVLKSDGLNITFKTNDRRWAHFCALFEVQGDDMYVGEEIQQGRQLWI